MTNQILVTGGTGRLGHAVVHRLLTAGHEVRVLSRRPQPAARRLPYVWITGDLQRGEKIDDAVAGVTAIVHCATMNGRADLAATRTLIEAARRSGGPHLVYVSIVGIDAVALRYYRVKLAVERILATCGLPWTILRTTQFHDLITRIFLAQRWTPVVAVPAGVSFQPIDVRDVAYRLVELAARPAAGRVPDLGGPQVRRMTDLASAYLQANGRRRLILPVPIAGKILHAYRAGGHLAPNNPAVGSHSRNSSTSISVR